MKTDKSDNEFKAQFNRLKKMNWNHEYAENGVVNEKDCKRIVAQQLEAYKAKLKENVIYQREKLQRDLLFIEDITVLIDTTTP